MVDIAAVAKTKTPINSYQILWPNGQTIKSVHTAQRIQQYNPQYQNSVTALPQPKKFTNTNQLPDLTDSASGIYTGEIYPFVAQWQVEGTPGKKGLYNITTNVSNCIQKNLVQSITPQGNLGPKAYTYFDGPCIVYNDKDMQSSYGKCNPVTVNGNMIQGQDTYSYPCSLKSSNSWPTSWNSQGANGLYYSINQILDLPLCNTPLSFPGNPCVNPNPKTYGITNKEPSQLTQQAPYCLSVGNTSNCNISWNQQMPQIDKTIYNLQYGLQNAGTSLSNSYQPSTAGRSMILSCGYGGLLDTLLQGKTNSSLFSIASESMSVGQKNGALVYAGWMYTNGFGNWPGNQQNMYTLPTQASCPVGYSITEIYVPIDGNNVAQFGYLGFKSISDSDSDKFYYSSLNNEFAQAANSWQSPTLPKGWKMQTMYVPSRLSSVQIQIQLLLDKQNPPQPSYLQGFGINNSDFISNEYVPTTYVETRVNSINYGKTMQNPVPYDSIDTNTYNYNVPSGMKLIGFAYYPFPNSFAWILDPIFGYDYDYQDFLYKNNNNFAQVFKTMLFQLSWYVPYTLVSNTQLASIVYQNYPQMLQPLSTNYVVQFMVPFFNYYLQNTSITGISAQQLSQIQQGLVIVLSGGNTFPLDYYSFNVDTGIGIVKQLAYLQNPSIYQQYSIFSGCFDALMSKYCDSNQNVEQCGCYIKNAPTPICTVPSCSNGHGYLSQSLLKQSNPQQCSGVTFNSCKQTIASIATAGSTINMGDVSTTCSQYTSSDISPTSISGGIDINKQNTNTAGTGNGSIAVNPQNSNTIIVPPSVPPNILPSSSSNSSTIIIISVILFVIIVIVVAIYIKKKKTTNNGIKPVEKFTSKHSIKFITQ